MIHQPSISKNYTACAEVYVKRMVQLLKEVLKSLGLLPKVSQETSESSPQPHAQWVQIKLGFFRSRTGGRYMFLESSLYAKVQLRCRLYIWVFLSRNPPS